MTKNYRSTLLNVYAKNNGYERLVLWVKDERRISIEKKMGKVTG